MSSTANIDFSALKELINLIYCNFSLNHGRSFIEEGLLLIRAVILRLSPMNSKNKWCNNIDIPLDQ
jgi:hypothetical protein